MPGLLLDAAQRGQRYLDSLPARRVSPTAEAIERLRLLDIPLQNEPVDAARVLAELDEVGSPATVASAGARYFGFVIGGSLPAAVAANVLAAAWDQNAGLYVASPIGSVIEDIARRWLVSLFGLPETTEVGFVTGATMANFTGLAAARHALLARQGWDVEERGLFGAPPITVVVGDEVHASMLKALSLVGFGRARVTRVPVDAQGRMRSGALPALNQNTIVCIQVGNVNSGAFDPAEEIVRAAHAAGAWVHVDGAFGLWAAACPTRSHLAAGVAGADSWATDAHKWLNVPYDSGLAFVREPLHLRAAMSSSAAYLTMTENREPDQYTPEMSRRARGVEVWAALRSLGRNGLAGMIERSCRHAARFAAGLRAAGHDVLNEVVLNQVVVTFGDAERTLRVIKRIQDEGSTWCGQTHWHGRTAMRISVSGWLTSDEDVERSLSAILSCAAD